MTDYIAEIQSLLSGQGFTTDQVSGISAGIYAESGGNPYAVNPKSGAFGIGQWLGVRKTNLFNTFGPNPTLTQQVSFLSSELKGGDGGGASVLNASGPGNILSNYITKFMRPKAGAETTGDISRGTSFLNTSGQYTPITVSPVSENAGTWGDQLAKINPLFGQISNAVGTALSAPGDAVDSAVKAVVPDLNSWFMRIGVGLLALIFIAAALFALKGGDVIQSVKGAVA